MGDMGVRNITGTAVILAVGIGISMAINGVASLEDDLSSQRDCVVTQAVGHKSSTDALCADGSTVKVYYGPALPGTTVKVYSDDSDMPPQKRSQGGEDLMKILAALLCLPGVMFTYAGVSALSGRSG